MADDDAAGELTDEQKHEMYDKFKIELEELLNRHTPVLVTGLGKTARVERWVILVDWIDMDDGEGSSSLDNSFMKASDVLGLLRSHEVVVEDSIRNDRLS